MERAYWRVGDVEKKGRTIFGMPIANDGDDNHALSDIKG